MNDALRYLERHHVWANRTLLARCRTLTQEQLTAPASAAYGPVIDTFRHLVMSDAGYLRSLGGPETRWYAEYQRAVEAAGAEPWGDGPMEDGDLDELERRIDELEARWAEHLDAEELDPDRRSVLDAGTYECPAGIVLAQVFHHGSLHREQICAALTALGVEAPDLQPWAFADDTGLSRFLGGRTS
jgi:uncharacterized damage-inducible protein DinB